MGAKMMRNFQISAVGTLIKDRGPQGMRIPPFIMPGFRLSFLGNSHLYFPFLFFYPAGTGPLIYVLAAVRAEAATVLPAEGLNREGENNSLPHLFTQIYGLL